MNTVKRLFQAIYRLSFVLAGAAAWPAGFVRAQGFQGTVDNINQQLGTAGQSGFGIQSGEEVTLGSIVGNYVTVFLGFVGTIAFVVFLYGGFLWLTARGNEDQVADAKKYLFNGTIGIVVIVFAYAAAYFITSQLYQAAR